jgi:hypothetical protein
MHPEQPGQAIVDLPGGASPVIDDPDVDGADEADEAEETMDVSPKNDVPGEGEEEVAPIEPV